MTITLSEPEAIPSDWDGLVALGKRCLKARAIADLTFARVCRKMLDGFGSMSMQDVGNVLGCDKSVVSRAVASLKIANVATGNNGDLERAYNEARRTARSPRRQPQPSSPEPPEESYMLDRDAAATLTAEIRETADPALLIDAEKGRADAALGFESWDRYVHAELDDVEFYATRDERQEAVQTLVDGGMSNRQIGHALHMDERTVRGDRAQASNGDGTASEGARCDGPLELGARVVVSPLHFAREAARLVAEIDSQKYEPSDLTARQQELLVALRGVLTEFSTVWETEENESIRRAQESDPQ